MAGELTVTAAKVASVFSDGVRGTEIVPMIAGATLTAGQPVYVATTGKAGVADANGSGTTQFRGIALNGGAAGQAVNVLKRGYVEGFDVSGSNCDVALFLSDTAGSIATSAGSLSVNVGRVAGLSELDSSGNAKKVVYIEADWLRTWA